MSHLILLWNQYVLLELEELSIGNGGKMLKTEAPNMQLTGLGVYSVNRLTFA